LGIFLACLKLFVDYRKSLQRQKVMKHFLELQNRLKSYVEKLKYVIREDIS